MHWGIITLLGSVQVCESFLEDCEDGFHGKKDIPNVPAFRHNSQYAADDSNDGIGATTSRRLRGYLPSKRRITIPVQKYGFWHRYHLHPFVTVKFLFHVLLSEFASVPLNLGVNITDRMCIFVRL